jgi:hypothetical protein
MGLLLIAAVCGAGHGAFLATLRPDPGSHLSELLWLVGLPTATIGLVLIIVSRAVADVVWQGLLLNLAATAIGVLATVFFVDVIVRRDREARWALVDQVALAQLLTAAASVLTRMVEMHHGQKPSGEVVDVGEDLNLFELNDDYLRFVEISVIPRLRDTLSQFTEGEWQVLAVALSGIREDFDNLVRVGDRMSPDSLRSVLESRMRVRDAEKLIQSRLLPGELHTVLVEYALSTILRNCIALLRMNWDSWEVPIRARDRGRVRL